MWMLLHVRKLAECFHTEGDDIVDLSPLAGLTTVDADLIIINKWFLSNPEGLSGLTSVGENIEITGNIVLAEFCELYPLLNGVGCSGNFTISGNA